MPKTFRLKESLPEGIYQARFCGTRDTESDAFGDGTAFDFEVVGGPFHGRKVGRITSPEPTALNACGSMLRGLGVALDKDCDLDPTPFVNRTYTIIVAWNKDRTSTRVDKIMPGANGSPVATNAAPAGPRKPPVVPRPAAQVKQEPKFYLCGEDGEGTLRTTPEIQEWVDAIGDAAKVMVMKTDDDGNALGDAYSPSSDFGFVAKGMIDGIPY